LRPSTAGKDLAYHLRGGETRSRTDGEKEKTMKCSKCRVDVILCSMPAERELASFLNRGGRENETENFSFPPKQKKGCRSSLVQRNCHALGEVGGGGGTERRLGGARGRRYQEAPGAAEKKRRGEKRARLSARQAEKKNPVAECRKKGKFQADRKGEERIALHPARVSKKRDVSSALLRSLTISGRIPEGKKKRKGTEEKMPTCRWERRRGGVLCSLPSADVELRRETLG